MIRISRHFFEEWLGIEDIFLVPKAYTKEVDKTETDAAQVDPVNADDHNKYQNWKNHRKS